MRGTTPNDEDAGNCTLGLLENVTENIQQPLGRENLLDNNLTGTPESSAGIDLFSTAMADVQNYNFLEMNLENNTSNTNETMECPEQLASNSCFHNTYDELDKQVEGQRDFSVN